MNDIYRQELLEIAKNPSYKGRLENPDVESTKKNPMCGDVITVQLNIENDTITDIKFDGQSCAVTTISADLLAEHLTGKTIQETQNYTKEDLLKLLDMNLTTSRVKCATLFLDATKEALSNYNKPSYE